MLKQQLLEGITGNEYRAAFVLYFFLFLLVLE